MFIRIFLSLLLMTTPALAANQWRGGTGASTIPGTTEINDIDAVSYQNIVDPLDRVLAGHRQGMNMQYSSATTIAVTAGEIVVSNTGETIRLMLRNTSSTNVTFANIDTGAEAAATTYYVYAGTNTASDATATFYISTNATTPSGVTYFKRIGSFYNDASSNITLINNDDQYSEFGDWVSKSIDVAYQASADGMFLGYITCDDFAVLTIATDSSSSPATTRQIVGCQSTTTGLYATFSVPVKSGDYYKATKSGSSDTYSAAAFFLPMGS